MNTHDYTREAENLMRTSVKLFSISLMIGTILLIAFIVFDKIEIAVFGFLYVLMALFFDGILFLNNVIFICLHREKRIPLLWHTLLLLVNLPITALYISIVFTHLNQH